MASPLATGSHSRSPGKRIGILGGMGPLATHAFYGTLIRMTHAERDQDHVRVVIDSDPTIPDRTAFLLGQGPDPRPAMISAAQRLRSAGAELIVMPCNTAGVFEQDVRDVVDLPFISWIESALTSVAAMPGRVGLLATTGTVATNVYQEALRQMGRDVVVPTPSEQGAIMEVIYGPSGVKTVGPSDGAAQKLIAVAGQMHRRGVEIFLMACTELPLALSAGDTRWPATSIDPANAAAEMAIRAAGAQLRGRP